VRNGNGSRGSGIHKFYKIAGDSGENIIRNSGVIEFEGGQTFDTDGGPHDMIRYLINTLKTLSFSMASKPFTRILTYKTFLPLSAILAVTAIVSAIFSSTIPFSTYAQEEQDSQGEVDSEEQQQQPSLPTLKDGSLGVELVADGLDNPTSMNFISNSDMIILQKDGEAVLVSTSGGEVSQNDDPPTVLDVPVNTASERGLLGIAVADSSSDNNNTGATKTFVFLYYTESSEGDSNIRNRIYRYEWDAGNMMLTRPTLILDLPAEPGPNHDGGKLMVEKDGRNTSLKDSQDYYHLYAVIGDLNRNGILQNFKNETADPDSTSGVFRLTPDGAAPTDNPFFDSSNVNSENNELSKYFAYGIRNSFGLTIDPLTGTMWMTENGAKNYDEINIVEPGFNSGWQQVTGPIERDNKNIDDLVQLDGSHYADPVFSWLESIGITDIEFLDSTKLGSKYANNIFVGDINNGNLYFFTVNESRTGITFEESEDGAQNNQDSLMDLVADNEDELSAITFGTGFEEGITDIETGPDGYLYILSFGGQLYRIVPR
jgi:glucose/arabinose dehydrogenase